MMNRREDFLKLLLSAALLCSFSCDADATRVKELAKVYQNGGSSNSSEKTTQKKAKGTPQKMSQELINFSKQLETKLTRDPQELKKTKAVGKLDTSLLNAVQLQFGERLSNPQKPAAKEPQESAKVENKLSPEPAKVAVNLPKAPPPPPAGWKPEKASNEQPKPESKSQEGRKVTVGARVPSGQVDINALQEGIKAFQARKSAKKAAEKPENVKDNPSSKPAQAAVGVANLKKVNKTAEVDLSEKSAGTLTTAEFIKECQRLKDLKGENKLLDQDRKRIWELEGQLDRIKKDAVNSWQLKVFETHLFGKRSN